MIRFYILLNQLVPFLPCRAYDRAALCMRGDSAEINYPLAEYGNDPVLQVGAWTPRLGCAGSSHLPKSLACGVCCVGGYLRHPVIACYEWDVGVENKGSAWSLLARHSYRGDSSGLLDTIQAALLPACCCSATQINRLVWCRSGCLPVVPRIPPSGGDWHLLAALPP